MAAIGRGIIWNDRSALNPALANLRARGYMEQPKELCSSRLLVQSSPHHESHFIRETWFLQVIPDSQSMNEARGCAGWQLPASWPGASPKSDC